MKKWALLILAATTLAPRQAAAAEIPSYTLAAILSGIWHGSTPGNNLQIATYPFTADPGHPYDLFVQIAGKYQSDNVRLQGVMRFDAEGSDVLLTYIPHFDPTITALSPQSAQFTDREATAACGLNMSARGDGFLGETLGSACALAIRGANSKWTIEAEPGSLRLRDAKTGETLRFKKVSK